MRLIIPLLLLSTAALGQTLDPALCSKAVQVVVNQRNLAADSGASSEARYLLLLEENALLKTEIEKLKKEGKP